MKKEPRYSDVKFNVSDLELRKHRIINKAPDKELKPCVNEYVNIPKRELIKWADLLYNTNYRPAQKVLHNIQHKLRNKKYITEKPESVNIEEICIVLNTLIGMILYDNTNNDYEQYINNTAYPLKQKLEKE